MILDRENALAYCALSARSNRDVLEEFCELFGYKPIIFTANQNLHSKRVPIYHTNVVMTLGESFAVICLDSIDNESEKEVVIRSLKRTEKEIIPISEEQLVNFAGNMLQLMNENGERFLVMSQTAHDSLDKDQIQGLKKHTEILVVEIPTIEKIGGGSARCMLAEVFVADE